MQLKLNSCSFTGQVDSSNIAWSHFARAWVKYGQIEKKRKKKALAEFSSVLSGFWRYSMVVFQLNIYQPSHCWRWKGKAELCLEVFSIVLCHLQYFIYTCLISATLRCRLPSPKALGIFCSARNAFQSFVKNFLPLFFFLLFLWSAVQCIRKLVPVPLARNSMLNSS